MPRPFSLSAWGAMTAEEVLRRWPRLCAHLICESLGYFSPLAAAGAILRLKQNEPNYCEWFYDYACKWRAREQAQRNRPFDETIKEVALRRICKAIKDRRYHSGPMASYPQARAIVFRKINKDVEPCEGFASWF